MAVDMKLAQPLSQEQYAKTAFRTFQANLPYPEKVKQVVAMQHRIASICASRGQLVVPWKI